MFPPFINDDGWRMTDYSNHLTKKILRKRWPMLVLDAIESMVIGPSPPPPRHFSPDPWPPRRFRASHAIDLCVDIRPGCWCSETKQLQQNDALRQCFPYPFWNPPVQPNRDGSVHVETGVAARIRVATDWCPPFNVECHLSQDSWVDRAIVYNVIPAHFKKYFPRLTQIMDCFEKGLFKS